MTAIYFCRGRIDIFPSSPEAWNGVYLENVPHNGDLIRFVRDDWMHGYWKVKQVLWDEDDAAFVWLAPSPHKWGVASYEEIQRGRTERHRAQQEHYNKVMREQFRKLRLVLRHDEDGVVREV